MALAELDPGNGSHIEALRIAQEIRDTRSAVDVGERERAHSRLLRFFKQRFGLHHPVLEAEPAMAIEEHGPQDLESSKSELHLTGKPSDDCR